MPGSVRVDLAAEISPGITARVAGPDDLARFSELISLTGAEDDMELAELLEAPEVAAAVMAGAEHGHEQFRLEMARQMAEAPYLSSAALAASLPMVAVTDTGEIVGALLAFPPGNVVEQYLGAQPAATGKDQQQLVIGGILGVVKLRALAVDPKWQSQGIGAGLLTRFKEIYLACRYFYLYGQFHPEKKFLRTDNGLEKFYSQQGFTILPKGRALDLWVVFGIGGGIFPDQGERIFYYHRKTD